MYPIVPRSVPGSVTPPQSEVEDLRLPVQDDQDAPRLDVAMHKAGAVCRTWKIWYVERVSTPATDNGPLSLPRFPVLHPLEDHDHLVGVERRVRLAGVGGKYPRDRLELLRPLLPVLATAAVAHPQGIAF